MVWGWIMGGQKTQLIVIHGNLNTQRYINEVLNAKAIPFMQRKVPLCFNAHPHTARITIFQIFLFNVLSILCIDALTNYLEPEVATTCIELNEKIACILKLLMK
jgi:uncharacterized protein YybS (DUF2232 family)